MRGAIPLLTQYVSIAWCLIKGYVFMAWCLVKHKDNFTFNFTDVKTNLGLYENLS
jgi:hypothetical protein